MFGVLVFVSILMLYAITFLQILIKADLVSMLCEHYVNKCDLPLGSIRREKINVPSPNFL